MRFRRKVKRQMSHAIDWSPVTAGHVKKAIQEYDRLGADAFFKRHGYAPTTTYDLITSEGTYPPKAILGTAYELATGRRAKTRRRRPVPQRAAAVRLLARHPRQTRVWHAAVDLAAGPRKRPQGALTSFARTTYRQATRRPLRPI